MQTQSKTHLLGCWVLVVLGTLPFLMQPIFLAIMGDVYGLNPTQLGLLAATDMIGMLVVSLLGFWWLPRCNHGHLIRLSIVTMAVGYFLIPSVGSFEMLLLIRAVSGLLGHGVAFVLATTLLCRTAKPERAIAISVVSQLFTSSVLVSGLPWVLGKIGLIGTFILIGTLILLLSSLCRGVVGESPTHRTQKPKGLSLSLALGWLLIALVCFQIGLSSVWAFIEPLASSRGLTLAETGQFLSIILPLSMSGSLLASRIDMRFGRLPPVLAAIILGITGLAIMVTSQTHLLFAAGFLCHQVAWNLGISYFYGAIVRETEGGGLESMAPGFQAAGTALGPLIAGLAVSGFTLEAVAWVSGSFMALALVILWAVGTKEPQRPGS